MTFSNPTSKRGLLAVLAILLVLGIAGCIGPKKQMSTSTPSTSAPVVSNYLLQQEGWGDKSTHGEKVLDKTFYFVRVVAVTNTEIYYDTELRHKVNRDTLGNFDQDLSTFFATRVDFDPNLTSIPVISSIVMNQVKDNTKKQFQDQMKSAGLVNIHETNGYTITVNTGETAQVYEYSADYRFSDIKVPVTKSKTITINGDTLTVNGILAIWQHDTDVMAAGGVYPAEDFETHTTQDLTDAITVSVDIDLGLRPRTYRDEVISLIKTVK